MFVDTNIGVTTFTMRVNLNGSQALAIITPHWKVLRS